MRFRTAGVTLGNIKVGKRCDAAGWSDDGYAAVKINGQGCGGAAAGDAGHGHTAREVNVIARRQVVNTSYGIGNKISA